MLADNMLLVPLQWEDLADPSARWTRWKVHNIATKTASVVNFKWTFWDLQWAPGVAIESLGLAMLVQVACVD